jgi:hypothetical protein
MYGPWSNRKNGCVGADLFDWSVAIAGGAIPFMAVGFMLGVAGPTLRNGRE